MREESRSARQEKEGSQEVHEAQQGHQERAVEERARRRAIFRDVQEWPQTALHGLAQFNDLTREQGGVVLRQDDTYFVVPVPNRSRTPHIAFDFDWNDIDRVRASHPSAQVIGYLHTHLNPKGMLPSRPDMATVAQFGGAPELIYNPIRRTLIWYTLHGIVRKERVRLASRP